MAGGLTEVEDDGRHRHPDPAEAEQHREPRRIAASQERRFRDPSHAGLAVPRDLWPDPRALPLADPAELLSREVKRPARASAREPRLQTPFPARPRARRLVAVELGREGADAPRRQDHHRPLDSSGAPTGRWTP
jgi:hypothetical protein